MYLTAPHPLPLSISSATARWGPRGHWDQGQEDPAVGGQHQEPGGNGKDDIVIDVELFWFLFLQVIELQEKIETLEIENESENYPSSQENDETTIPEEEVSI